MSAVKKVKTAKAPESGPQQVAAPAPLPPSDKLKCLALRALGGCKAIDNEDPVDSHLDAIALDLDMIYLAMTNQNEEVDAFRLNHFIRRLIDRVGVVREIYSAKGDGT